MHHISKIVNVNKLLIGGDHPVVIQTMWKDRLSIDDLDKAAARIEGLAGMGCGLLRFAVPDIAAAEVLGRLAQMVSMPLVADIHFDYKIALACMDYPVAKIRINPGNIGNKDRVRAVLEKAGEKGVAIRIGVNAGSLPQDLRENLTRNSSRKGAEGENSSVANALVEAAERELAICEEFNFSNVLVSMKASNIADTIVANRLFAARSCVPLHIGVTEAGPLVAGAVRSGAALSVLLSEGIGDTIRVSLSDSMENEIIAAREICTAAAEMACLNKRPDIAGRLQQDGVTIISCPRCGRFSFDTHGFSSRWLSRLYSLNARLTIAIMGCEVNGPQEAQHADLGITGAGNKALIFKQGEVVRTVCVEDADAAFEEELKLLLR